MTQIHGSLNQSEILELSIVGDVGEGPGLLESSETRGIQLGSQNPDTLLNKNK